MGPAPVDPLAYEWQLLPQVLEHMPVAVVLQRGPELVYVYANARAEAVLSAPGGLVGRTIQDVHPEIKDLATTMWGRALAGETVVEHAFPVEAGQGPRDPVARRYFDLTLAPIVENRLVAGVLTVFAEVTGDVARSAELERRVEHEHEVLTVLQRALLPRTLPDVPGWLLAATYEPADRGDVVGGDFYDVLTWRGGALLVLGDVSGKGAAAASITAELRGALRALAAQDLELSEILRWVDRMLTAAGDDFCTLAVATLAPHGSGATGKARVFLAGHPPALCLRGEGGGSVIGTPTPPLGMGLPIEPAADEVNLAIGDTLVLYTDGLLEARAPARLVDPIDLPVLLGSMGPLELEHAVVCIRTKLVGGPGRGRDDLAILAARRTG